jgi:hypothetical protein
VRRHRAAQEHRAADRLVRPEVAQHIGTPSGGEVRRDAEGRAIRYLDRRPRQVQRDDRGVQAKRRAEHHRYLVVLPRVQVDDLTVGEQLGDAGGEDAEVGA